MVQCRAMGTIRIDNLAIEAIIGTLPSEREAPQRIFASIEVDTDTRTPAETDDLGLALDYRELADCVTELALTEEFLLIETLVERAASRLRDTFPVTRALVAVRKPAAIPEAEWVEVSAEIC